MILKCLGANIDLIKKNLHQVLHDNQVVLSEIFDVTPETLTEIARELSQVNIITNAAQKKPTYDAIVEMFRAGLKLKKSLSDIEGRCVKFLTALSNVGGPVADAADMLRDEWTASISEITDDINLDCPAQRLH